MITCKMNLGESDYRVLTALNYQILRKTPQWRLKRALALLLCFLYFLLALWSPYLGVLFMILSFSFLFLFLFYGKLLLYRLNKVARKANVPNANLERTYCFFEDHIEITTDLSTNSFSWKLLECYYAIDNYLILQEKNQTLLLVDETRLSPLDRQELYRYLYINHIFQKIL